MKQLILLTRYYCK